MNEIIPFTIPNIFMIMLLVGFCSFGGGPGCVSIIKDLVLSNAWIGEQEYLDLVTMSQVNPFSSGIIMAAYIGGKRGLLGAAAAVAGIVLPAVVIMIIILLIGKRFYADKRFQYTVKYINLFAVAVICSLVYSMLTVTFSNDPIVYIAVAAMACYVNLRFEFNPALLIGAGALFGLFWRA